MSPTEAIATLSRLAEVLADLPEDFMVVAVDVSNHRRPEVHVHRAARHGWFDDAKLEHYTVKLYRIERRVNGVNVFTLATPEEMPAWALFRLDAERNAAIDRALAIVEGM